MKLPSFRSLIVVALATFALSFGTASALAEEPTPPPTSSQQPAKPAAETVVKPAARREDLEPTTLADAKAELKKARTDRDTAEAELANEQASHEKSKQLLKTTIETCKAAQSDRDKFQGEATANKAGWDKELAAHVKSKELLTLAEGALQVKGISTAETVPAVEAPQTKQSISEWDRKISAEKDPKKRAQLTADFEKAYTAGQVA